MNIVIDKAQSGDIVTAHSDDGRFTYWDHSRDFIFDHSVNRLLHVGGYLKRAGEGFGSDPISPELAQTVLDFWAALRAEGRKIAADYDAAQRAAFAAECEAEQQNRYCPEITGEARERLAREYDLVENEGEEGFNPWG